MVSAPENAPGSLALFDRPIVPFIRQSEFAVRKPWPASPARRLLDYLIKYVQEGHCIVRVSGVAYHLYEGDFCLVQPNEIVTLEGPTNTITPYAHLDIFYNPLREHSFPTRPGQVDISSFRHLIQPRLNDCNGIYIPVKFVPSQPARFRETLLRMVGVWQNRDMLSQLEAQLLATELVLMLLTDFGHLQSLALPEPYALNWVTSYLSLHLSEPISVADMAERAHLSVSRFSALFRQQFGCPPHQYLLHLRIHHAQHLLSTGEFTLRQIAVYCGFADVPHFSKAFKRVTGRPPGVSRGSDQLAHVLPVFMPQSPFGTLDSVTGILGASGPRRQTVPQDDLPAPQPALPGATRMRAHAVARSAPRSSRRP
jgi:AraC-like DNA-binding protein